MPEERETMLTKDAILRTLARLKPGLAQRYHITQLALAGSFARGEATEQSDVDIAADFQGIDLFDLVDIREIFQEHLGKKVDVIVLSPHINPYLKDRIEKEAIYV